MKWKTVTGYTKPQEREVGKTTAYLRKNQREITDKDGNLAWEYEECQMSLAEYEKYIKETQSPTMENIMQTLSGIEAEQAMQGVLSDSNTETIMQTLSDIQAEIELLKE